MNPLIKVPLRYGLLAGTVGSILLIALYYLGRHPLLIPPYADFRIILFVVFILFTLRELRDYHYNGILYFWQGIIASFIFTVCFAVVTGIFIVSFMQLVPAFLSDYVSLTLVQLRTLPEEAIEKIGKDVYERNIEMLPSTNGVMLGLTYVFQSFVISLFISIILSVTLRRQLKP
jgi:hypothetical protein